MNQSEESKMAVSDGRELAAQWTNGNREFVLEALKELTPLQAAILGMEIYGRLIKSDDPVRAFNFRHYLHSLL